MSDSYISRPIGVIDSGCGGLSCVRAIHRVNPNARIYFLGDTAHVPYGDRSPEEILGFTMSMAAELKRQNIVALAVACGTISSLWLPELRKALPGIPIEGTIAPTVDFLKQSGIHDGVGLIATTAAVRAGSYAKALREAGITENLTAKACPSFVPIVERGICSGAEAEKVVENDLSEFLGAGNISTLILGCTHFPFLADIIHKRWPEIRLVNPSELLAKAILSKLPEVSSGESAFRLTAPSPAFDTLLCDIYGEENAPSSETVKL